LLAGNLRENARNLHGKLLKVFTGTQEQMKLNGNLKALDQRLLSLEEELDSLASTLGGQRVFTDDPRLHPFLESVGLEVIATVDLGVNGAVSEEQRAAIAAQAASLPARVLIVTHPEKKEQLGELAREADLTLVYFNPFYDGVTGVGQIDSIIPRQLRMLGLAMNAALASASTE
jgi:ABC-type Zn uptake system ZnuABC Zn-binding protein ZnuA